MVDVEAEHELVRKVVARTIDYVNSLAELHEDLRDIYPREVLNVVLPNLEIFPAYDEEVAQALGIDESLAYDFTFEITVSGPGLFLSDNTGYFYYIRRSGEVERLSREEMLEWFRRTPLRRRPRWP